VKKTNSKRPKARFVRDNQSTGTFSTTTKNTGLSQRGTLEAIILNLADHLGVDEVYKITSSRGADYYRCPMTGGASTYQSATNTIFEMSKMLAGAYRPGEPGDGD
jgi:hypothetical protein